MTVVSYLQKNLQVLFMERICNIADDFSQAEEWDIAQQVSMTREERQAAAKALKERFFGKDCPDVRDQYKK